MTDEAFFLSTFDRVPNLVEYVMTPLLSGLADNSPYVRKAAVMGCVKLFYLDKRAVRGMVAERETPGSPCFFTSR